MTLASIVGDAGVERRWTLGRAGVGLGVGAEADMIWQTLERTDATRVAAAGYPTTQRYAGLAPGPVALARLRVQLALRMWIELAARGGVLFPQLTAGLGGVWTVRAGIGAGVQF